MDINLNGSEIDNSKIVKDIIKSIQQWDPDGANTDNLINAFSGSVQKKLRTAYKADTSPARKAFWDSLASECTQDSSAQEKLRKYERRQRRELRLFMEQELSESDYSTESDDVSSDRRIKREDWGFLAENWDKETNNEQMLSDDVSSDRRIKREDWGFLAENWDKESNNEQTSLEDHEFIKKFQKCINENKDITSMKPIEIDHTFFNQCMKYEIPGHYLQITVENKMYYVRLPYCRVCTSDAPLVKDLFGEDVKNQGLSSMIILAMKNKKGFNQKSWSKGSLSTQEANSQSSAAGSSSPECITVKCEHKKTISPPDTAFQSVETKEINKGSFERKKIFKTSWDRNDIEKIHQENEILNNKGKKLILRTLISLVRGTTELKNWERLNFPSPGAINLLGKFFLCKESANTTGEPIEIDKK